MSAEKEKTVRISLPYDNCRCHDSLCPKKDECLRWIIRNGAASINLQTYKVKPIHPPKLPNHIPHQSTFRKTPEDKECDFCIPLPEEYKKQKK